MRHQPHILIVDDEAEVRELLADFLSDYGCRVRTAANAGAARRMVATEEFDAALVDVTMPGEDGFSLARHLRAGGDLGLLMITASGDVFDRVVGLELGADDYIVKPFLPKDVVLRLNSVLRRAARPLVPKLNCVAASAAGGWEFDAAACRLVSLSGQITPLRPNECRLLQAFLSRANQPLSRSHLRELTGQESASDRAIDVRIARLRQKIEPVPAKPQIIKTIRGAGYMYVSNSA